MLYLISVMSFLKLLNNALCSKYKVGNAILFLYECLQINSENITVTKLDWTSCSFRWLHEKFANMQQKTKKFQRCKQEWRQVLLYKRH